MGGLTIGPRLAGGSYVIVAGTDNDYSVTQNQAGNPLDVYFNFADADPYATSIQCPLDQVIGCLQTADGAPATPTGAYQLLPGVLHAYTASESDLSTYVSPAGRCLSSSGRGSGTHPGCGRSR